MHENEGKKQLSKQKKQSIVKLTIHLICAELAVTSSTSRLSGLSGWPGAVVPTHSTDAEPI